MKKLLNVLEQVGRILIERNEPFASSPGLDGDSSYHDLFPGKDKVIVWDDSKRSQWNVRLDLDTTPEDKETLPNLVSTMLGAPCAVHRNGACNWMVDDVLVVTDGDGGGVEFFLDYDKVARRRQ